MSNKKNTVYFITGGGTGGHIYPAVSVIEKLLSDGVKKENIFYLGNKKNLEYEIAQKNGYNFLSYSAKGMPRKINFKFFGWFIGLFFSILQALIYVFKYKPSVVFATGGYVCAPILFCALFLKIPYILHESDIQPGLVTKLFAKNATVVSLGFESAKEHISAKNIVLSGNPIREEFKKITKQMAKEELSFKNEFIILIMGGSLGAKTINDSSFEILRKYANTPEYKILWQTGKKNFDDITKKILEEFEELPDNLILQPYFHKMYLALLSADIVISRAGSLSLSEICACALPSILIPYPYASQDHQKKNALKLVENKVALMIEDKDCNNKTLLETVEKLINDKTLLQELAQNAKKYAKLNSTEEIVTQINQAIKE